jgi:hypothetical protein
MTQWDRRQRGTEPSGAMAGALPGRPISALVALGEMVSGRKRGDGGGLPHLVFDRRREVVACSRGDELLWCLPVLSVDSAQAILFLWQGVK